MNNKSENKTLFEQLNESFSERAILGKEHTLYYNDNDSHLKELIQEAKKYVQLNNHNNKNLEK